MNLPGTLEPADLEDRTVDELQALAREMSLAGLSGLRKSDLIERIVQAHAAASGITSREGLLEVMSEGWGFLRSGNLQSRPDDPYVSQSQIKRFGLRVGDIVTGQVRPPKEGEKFHSLLRVDLVHGRDPETSRARPDYANLTTIYPNRRLIQETPGGNLSARIIDLIAPIGKGQRGLIVSPPKAGKTTILKQIAHSLNTNNPDVSLIVLLVDERPEEVTDIRRSVRGRVVASTFDDLAENHVRVADLVLETAKRQVECGKDVVILLDSITRYSRASNLTVTPTGRTLSGGLDPGALHRPKRFFGAARNIEEGGSLTIIATALVDTGSRLDDMIFEEFKGTGNWEVHLSRELQERRIFPAIDIKKSGTRHDELLFDEASLKQIWKLHRALAALDTVEATELLIDRLRATKTNDEFLKLVDKTMR